MTARIQELQEAKHKLNLNWVKLMIDKMEIPTAPISKYREGVYYESKNKRIGELKLTDYDIALTIVSVIVLLHNIAQIQGVAAKIANQLYRGNDLPEIEKIKTALELLGVMKESGMYKVLDHKHPDNPHDSYAIKPIIKPNSEILKYAKGIHYPPPMLIPPRDWVSNTEGGFLTYNSHIMLGNQLSKHDELQAYDAVNMMQQTAWELTPVIEKPEPAPKGLDKEVFKMTCEQTKKVHRDIKSTGNKFYFTWKYDKRGRMYSQGYHVNLQSNEYHKACIQFKRKERISTEIIDL